MIEPKLMAHFMSNNGHRIDLTVSDCIGGPRVVDSIEEDVSVKCRVSPEDTERDTNGGTSSNLSRPLLGVIEPNEGIHPVIGVP